MQLDFSQHINLKSLSPETLFEEKVISFLEEWQSGSRTVQVQTSGSTGAPKVFDVEKERMLNSAHMTCDFLGLHKGDSALLCLPMEYISGKMMLVRALERGLKLFISEPSSKPLESINQEIEFCAMTPLQVQHSLDKIHLIKNLIIGGAAVSENLKRHFDRLSVTYKEYKVFETYGMSETLSHIALKQIAPMQDDCFTVLDEVEIAVDERNCLKIWAPKLNPEQLQTNDMVELKNNKQFRFVGRYDNVINSGGVKIFAEELEQFVKSHLGKLNVTTEMVFLGKPDEVLGEKLVLVMEKDASTPIKTTEIAHHLSLITYKNRFHIPKEVVFLEKFPRSENGKVLRKEILKQI